VLYRALDDLENAQSHKFIQDASKNTKYVLFKQLQGAGFNNQAQEILLFHHLALLSSRIYVYQPLVWRPRGEHSLVPLSAFLLGATQGSISAAVFNSICPPSETTHVTFNDLDAHADLWSHAQELLTRDDRCVVVDHWILNWDYLSSTAIYPIWPSFQTYLANHFKWADPVLRIVDRAYSMLTLRSNPRTDVGEPYMALHLRRGDFENHCNGLAQSHTGFTTWATLPLLTASIFPPVLDSRNQTSILEHCYPTMSRILNVIDFHARARPRLRSLHVLHDGAWDHPLVYAQEYQLQSVLKSPKRALAQGWANGPMKRVTHSGLLPIRWGEGDWAVAVDVELGRRADIFIGNGFSSLSTQIIALRLGADGGRVEDISLL